MPQPAQIRHVQAKFRILRYHKNTKCSTMKCKIFGHEPDLLTMLHSMRCGRGFWFMPEHFAFHRWTFGIFYDIVKFEILLAHDESEPVEALFFMNFVRWCEFHCSSFIFKCLVEWLHRREIASAGTILPHLRLAFLQLFRC